MVDKSKRGAKPFRFFNYLAEHEDFTALVEAGWQEPVQGNYMKSVWEKLKNVKQELKKLPNT